MQFVPVFRSIGRLHAHGLDASKNVLLQDPKLCQAAGMAALVTVMARSFGLSPLDRSIASVLEPGWIRRFQNGLICWAGT